MCASRHGAARSSGREIRHKGHTQGMPSILALSGGATIFAVVIVLLVLTLAYTTYSKSGSGIDAHPIEGDMAPGSGHESGLQDPDHSEFRETFDDRGGR